MNEEKKLKLIKNKQKEHENFEHDALYNPNIEKAKLMGFLHQKLFKSRDIFKEFVKLN